MSRLQEQSRRELLQACASPGSSERVSQLLLRLIPLKTFIPAIMEELFFSALTGSVQIDNIIPYILRMETAEYNLQMTGQTGAAAVAGISGSVGVPALHDPSAPHQPASVPVILDTNQSLQQLGTVQETVTISGDGTITHANGQFATNGTEVQIVTSGTGSQIVNTTHSGQGGSIQRASLISEAGQVLTLYSDGGSGQTSQTTQAGAT